MSISSLADNSKRLYAVRVADTVNGKDECAMGQDSAMPPRDKRKSDLRAECIDDDIIHRKEGMLHVSF